MPDVTPTAEQVAEDLQAVVEQAKTEVAESAIAEEEKRQEIARLDAIERRLGDIESRSAASTVTETAAAPVVAAGETSGGALGEVKEAIADLAESIAEPVADVADTVTEPVADVAEDVADVVETLPRRTHGLFRKLPFGARHDD